MDIFLVVLLQQNLFLHLDYNIQMIVPVFVPGAYLTTARRYMNRNPLGNVNTWSFWCGGSDSGNTTLSSSDRLTYSTETTAALPETNLVNSVPNFQDFLG